MRIIEALVLLSLGLFLGIISTVLDVFIVGSPAFIAHFTFWVLLNTVLGSLIENRGKAIWWSIPLNLGYIESYFITTVATYESYVKASVVPLLAMAALSPLLTYAAWTAKGERNVLGYLLGILIVVGTIVSEYFINGSVSAYSGVMCVLIALLLLVPFRRFQFTRVGPSEQVEPTTRERKGTRRRRRS